MDKAQGITCNVKKELGKWNSNLIMFGAYLDLFVARAYKDNPDKKFGGNFILPKNDPQIKTIEAVIKAVAKEEFDKGQRLFSKQFAITP